MATIQQYVKNMRDTQWEVALKMGVDLQWDDKHTRVILMSGFVVQAIVMKALVDSGAVTDAALKTTMDNVRAAIYAQEPNEPTGWPDISPGA
jgi:hypothetical protein